MVAKLVCTFVLLLGAVAFAEESLGTSTSIEEFPSLAQVEISLAVLWVQQCAATVLTNRHVLSVATCFTGDLYFPEYRRIRAGSSYRGRDGIVLGVEYAIIQPNFGLLGQEADLAVVRLDNYLTLNAQIQQVSIIGEGIELPGGLPLDLVGWGTTTQGGETSNINLHRLTVIAHDNDNCMEQYFGRQIVTENMVCAGLEYTKGRDFDDRDIAAPLYFSNTLVGLLAFGEVADDEYPLVATSIASYTQWIIGCAV